MGSGTAAAEFERRFREAAQAGRPPDRLNRYSTDEAERFYAQVVPGPEGHSFWTGAQTFRCNGGKTRLPKRWVWARTHGTVAHSAHVIAICGEPACVTPGHLAIADHGLARRRYTDQALIGYLQVAALRLGHPPSLREWREHGYRPVWEIFRNRFGGWAAAKRRAGLK
jgi:HNH endonuclease